MKFSLALMMFLITTLAQALTIGAYNIRNFDYDTRYRIKTNKPALAEIIKNVNADILTVEEISNTQEFERFVSSNLPGYSVTLSRCGGRGQHHLGFVYNTRTVELLSFNEDLSITDPGGNVGCDTSSRPLAIALFKDLKTNKKFYGLAAHLKAGSAKDAIEKRHTQISIISDWINHLKTNTGVKDYFVAGDLNTTLYYNNGVDYRALEKFAAQNGLVNATHTAGCSAYWWGGTNDNIEDPSLLDHVFISKTLIGRKGYTAKVGSHCQQASCRPQEKRKLGVSYNQVSDHCPISTTF
ncbi:MAG TPA: endonuclease/exonuclease/phosphatase family protein [Bacteriovoracaceae bacterium]|nr:endonuclease/exonuclease/phosphatase family protein [Bacteriovoracaceae bacterium]HLW55868.1 endonuclease/exonuclease/phosphatase family protein [Bacteriovoracaceae bacterium]